MPSNSPPLTILWIKAPAPEIPEIRYSYQFCRNVGHDACMSLNRNVHWFDVSPEDSLGGILSQQTENLFLAVLEPEIVLTSASVNALIRSISPQKPICGPVYNDTEYSDQQAALPWIYHNGATLEEFSEAAANKPHTEMTFVEELDPACILYHPEALKGLSPDMTLGGICQAAGKTKTVIPYAFVHRFVHYYQSERPELTDLIPEHAEKILDVGCAKGGYGKAVRKRFPDGVHLTGVEVNPALAESAREHYDEVIVSPVESADLPKGYDLINCGDVMEHLYDPWAMLKVFHRLLKPGGHLVLSVPNAGHWSIVKDLAAGRFQYIPAGLLCITHIRWFTETGIRDALYDSGFIIETLQKQKTPPTPGGKAFIDDLCAKGYGDEDSLMTHAFVIRAAKDPAAKKGFKNS